MPPSKKRKVSEQSDNNDNIMKTTWIALLRGINVGGKRLVRMVELRSAITAEKNSTFHNVKTYIQTGNIAFNTNSDNSSDMLCDALGDCMQDTFGFRPPIMLVTLGELQQAFDNNPFKAQAAQYPNKVHFFFLGQEPDKSKNDWELSIEKVKVDSEEYSLNGKVFYLLAGGTGRSKLACNVERLLGVPATGRIYKTIEKTLALAKETDGLKEADCSIEKDG